MTIYIDVNDGYKCYVSNDGTRVAYETNEFDGKCQTFIEGHRLVPDGEIWVREDGMVFGPVGTMISPWKPNVELEKAQFEYEIELLKAENSNMKDALAELGVTEDD